MSPLINLMSKYPFIAQSYSKTQWLFSLFQLSRIILWVKFTLTTPHSSSDAIQIALAMVCCFVFLGLQTPTSCIFPSFLSNSPNSNSLQQIHTETRPRRPHYWSTSQYISFLHLKKTRPVSWPITVSVRWLFLQRNSSKPEKIKKQTLKINFYFDRK